MTDNGILVTLLGCSESQPLQFESQPANVTFRLDQLPYGKSYSSAGGNLVIQRVPAIEPLATTHADEDYPAAATGKDGTVYVAYLAFTRGRDFQGARERVATEESEAGVESRDADSYHRRARRSGIPRSARRRRPAFPPHPPRRSAGVNRSP